MRLSWRSTMAGLAQGNLRGVAGRPSLRRALATKQSIVAAKLDCFVARALAKTSPNCRHTPCCRHALAPRGATRPGTLPETFRPGNRGRGECRVPAAPAAPCAEKSTGVEATGTPESPGIPARNGFNGFLRAPRCATQPNVGRLETCQPNQKMSVHRVRPEVAGLRSEQRD
jgi:hypothetical protein